jgi:uncharacterized protein (TIGR01777 family)
MRIAMTGSSGLIGSALMTRFEQDGHAITRVVRGAGVRDPRHRTVVWDPAAGAIDRAGLEAHDAVVHLAGEDIAAGRWTQARKQVIRESRIRGTLLLCETLAGLAHKPRVLITASGVGYYGNHEPDDRVDETSPRGAGFLADLVRDWEQATTPAKAAGIRVVHTRFGIVLSPRGGALAKMLPVFRMGLGGKVGSGRQAMSWIALDDVPSVMLHLIEHDSLSGPVNVVSPHVVTNAEFTRILGQALGRPAILPLPGFAARLLFGEMADALLLGGARVIPKRLEDTGYRFAYPRLDQALSHLLSPPTGHRAS